MHVADQTPDVFTICMNGPKCSLKYRLDYERRVKASGAQGQGTGDLCADLAALAKERGIDIKAMESDCLDLCPMPWDRANLIGPDGKLHRVYFEDLPALLDELYP